MPLWKTWLRVVIDHAHPDDRYRVTYEGVLGNIAGSDWELSVCIGGKGVGGEGRWIDVQPLATQLSHTTVTVYEI